MFDKLRYREEKANAANECNVKILKINEIPAFLRTIEKASRKISTPFFNWIVLVPYVGCSLLTLHIIENNLFLIMDMKSQTVEDKQGR